MTKSIQVVSQDIEFVSQKLLPVTYLELKKLLVNDLFNASELTANLLKYGPTIQH